MKNVFLIVCMGLCLLSYGKEFSFYVKPLEDFSIYDRKLGGISYPLAYLISRSDLIILGKIDDKKRKGNVNVIVEKIVAST